MTINRRPLTVFAIVALPLLVVAGLLAFNAGESNLRDNYGRELTHVAELVTGATDVYAFRRVLDASLLARVPTIRSVSIEASRRPFDQAAALDLDQQWQSSQDLPPPAAAILQNEASRYLVDLAAHDGIYKEILVTDRSGRLIAATNRTSDFYQADEEWWQEAFAGGVRGKVFVSGIHYDDSAAVNAINIAAPVVAADDSQVVGVIKVIVDVRELASIIEAFRLGETGAATLVREDGSLVLAPPGAASRFFAADQLREHVTTKQQGAESLYQLHFRAVLGDGSARLVGVAPSQLGASYPNLNWLVAVSQAESELFSPLRTQASWLLLVLAVSALAVLVLATWFSTQLATPPIPENMHLSVHPHVHRVDEDVADVHAEPSRPS